MAENIIKTITSGKKAKDALLKGVNTVCDVVSDTMGSRGNINIFESLGGMPITTKDGFKSLEQMFLDDPVEALACQIVKEACNRQLDTVGDNTTLVCVLTQAFFKYSVDELNKGKSSVEIKLDIESSVEKVIKHLESMSVPLTEELMYHVAKTSANGDADMAKIVQEAYIKAGDFGIVSHKRSFSDETYIKHISGNPIESGYTHEGFINIQETQSVVFDDALVLCSMINFLTANEIIPFLDYASKLGKPLVIISNMEQDVSNMILSNVQSHKYPFVIIKPPYMGKKQRETMADLALILGCEVLSGITRTNYEGKENTYLGTCKRIEIDKKDSVITKVENINNELIKSKIDELNSNIKLAENEGEKNYLRERISKITGGISTIMMGGITPSEVDEKIDRLDDAICAVRSAKDGGVVAGGGVALYKIYRELSGEIDDVTKKVLLAPFEKIISNAGLKDITLRDYPMGYDVFNFKEVDMFESGILDTVKGIKSALENSASASNNLIRTNNVITLKRQSNAK